MRVLADACVSLVGYVFVVLELGGVLLKKTRSLWGEAALDQRGLFLRASALICFP